MNREVKKRYKMYKAGKDWVVAPIVFLGLAAGLGYQANVKADNVSSSTSGNSENAQQSKVNSLGSQSSVALKSSHSAVQPQAASKEETVNFAVQPTSKAATSSLKTSVTSDKADQTINQSKTTANDAPTTNKTDNQTPEKQNLQDQSKQANDQTHNQPAQDQTQPNYDQQNGQNTTDNTAKKDDAVKSDTATSSSSSAASSSSVHSQKVDQAQEHDGAVQINQNGQ